MSVSLLQNSPPPTFRKDWQGQFVGQATWYVDIRDAAGALAFAKTNSGVDVNMPFPGVPNLLADAVQTSPASDGVGTLITLTFSTDRRFGGWQTIDKDRPGYYSFDVDVRSVQFPTPVNIYAPVTVAGPDGDVDEHRWTIEIHPIEEPRFYVSVNVAVDDWDKNKTAACVAQVGKVHTIGGVDYLYRGCKTYQRRQSPVGTTVPARGSWDVTHDWAGDPGTERVDSPDPDKFVVGLNTAQRRKPHWKYVVVPSADPKTTEHEVRQYQYYDADPQGYLQLPGMPPI